MGAATETRPNTAEETRTPRLKPWESQWVRDIPLQRPLRANPGSGGATAEASQLPGASRGGLRRGGPRVPRVRRHPNLHRFRLSLHRGGLQAAARHGGPGQLRSNSGRAGGAMDPALLAQPVRFFLQYHADQDVDQLCRFWGGGRRRRSGRDRPPAQVEQQSASETNLEVAVRRPDRARVRHAVSGATAGVDGLPAGDVVRLAR
jgi:hypothetical protein